MFRYLLLIFSLVFCIITKNVSSVNIDDKCLMCICEATSGCSTSLGCFSVRNKTFCGPYQISYEFWFDAGRPGANFEACGVSKKCSELAIRAYVKKYANDCNNDGRIDCLDFAIIHKVGPKCANSDWLQVTDYWNAFTETLCYTTKYASNPQLSRFPLSLTKNKTKLVTSDCLKCICEASTFCNPNQQCINGYCGPYLISEQYWIDGGKLGGDYVRCSTNATCAETLIQNYMRKYHKDCNNDGVIDCDDFAAIHQLGPECTISEFSEIYKTNYWNHFEYCSVMETNARREVPAISYFTLIRGLTEGYGASGTSRRPQIIKKFVFPKFTAKPVKLIKQISNQLIDVNEGCLECMCEANGGCDLNTTNCFGGGSCGIYQINREYWSSAGRPGYRGEAVDFQRCVTNKRCADETIRGYMNKHAFDCNRDGVVDCLDFVLIHKNGPKHCTHKDVLHSEYWTRFDTCYGFSR